MTMTCPKCGRPISLYDGDIEIHAIGPKHITVEHISFRCQGRWKYKR